jgi:hypothetical protein
VRASGPEVMGGPAAGAGPTDQNETLGSLARDSFTFSAGYS